VSLVGLASTEEIFLGRSQQPPALAEIKKAARLRKRRRVIAKWQPYAGFIYFHLLLDRLTEGRTFTSGTAVKIGIESIISLTQGCSGPQLDVLLGLFAAGWRVTGRDHR
jgi:hypothetical protein